MFINTEAAVSIFKTASLNRSYTSRSHYDGVWNRCEYLRLSSTTVFASVVFTGREKAEARCTESQRFSKVVVTTFWAPSKMQ
jgi:hypothetical protein